MERCGCTITSQESDTRRLSDARLRGDRASASFRSLPIIPSSTASQDSRKTATARTTQATAGLQTTILSSQPRFSRATCSARQPVQPYNPFGQTIRSARQPYQKFPQPATLGHRSERHTTITHAPAVHSPRLRQTLLDRRRIPTRLHIEQFHFKRRTRTSRKQKEDTTEERQQESPGGVWLHMEDYSDGKLSAERGDRLARTPSQGGNGCGRCQGGQEGSHCGENTSLPPGDRSGIVALAQHLGKYGTVRDGQFAMAQFALASSITVLLDRFVQISGTTKVCFTILTPLSLLPCRFLCDPGRLRASSALCH